MEYGVCYYIADPMTNLGIASEVRRAIWKVFRDQGVETPYPQRVIRSAEAGACLPGGKERSRADITQP